MCIEYIIKSSAEWFPSVCGVLKSSTTKTTTAQGLCDILAVHPQVVVDDVVQHPLVVQEVPPAVQLARQRPVWRPPHGAGFWSSVRTSVRSGPRVSIPKFGLYLGLEVALRRGCVGRVLPGQIVESLDLLLDGLVRLRRFLLGLNRLRWFRLRLDALKRGRDETVDARRLDRRDLLLLDLDGGEVWWGHDDLRAGGDFLAVFSRVSNFKFFDFYRFKVGLGTIH